MPAAYSTIGGMTQSLPYFDPRMLSQLNGVRLPARGVVEGFVAGSHRSPFHGFAAEFAEHREYTPGDDLRYVDWKVFGRSDRLFVKQFEAETNFACHILLDASESMRFQSESPWGLPAWWPKGRPWTRRLVLDRIDRSRPGPDPWPGRCERPARGNGRDARS